MPNRFIILFLLLLFVVPLSAQTKLSHWTPVPVRYTTVDTAKEPTSHAEWSMSSLIVVPYHIFISNVDGDRCAFAPTCSAFFVDACRQTNIFQGTLMFFDRFTRDSNTLDRNLHYPADEKRNRLIDPACNYRLLDSLIIVEPHK